MASTVQAHKWGWEHWAHIPRKRTIVGFAAAIVALLALVTWLSQASLRRESAPAQPVPAVIERNVAAMPVVAPPAAVVDEAAPVLIRIEEPIIIRGEIPKR